MVFLVVVTSRIDYELSNQELVTYVGPFADKESADAYISLHPELNYKNEESNEESGCLSSSFANVQELIKP